MQYDPTAPLSSGTTSPGPHRCPDPGVGRRVRGPNRAVANPRGRAGRAPRYHLVGRGRRPQVRVSRPEPRLLARQTAPGTPGRRHKKYLPRLTTAAILGWADAHHTRTGDWPHQGTGPVTDAPGESWAGIDTALRVGGRGLPGNSSLAQLLAAARGVRNHLALPRLTATEVLAWADAHHDRTGEWPTRDSGPVVGAPGEVWSAVNTALNAGSRGLAEGGSLARLLSEHRGVRNPAELPRLAAWEVLLWADAHHERTGHWPTAESGPVAEAPGEKWSALDTALRDGTRGLPGGDSLARLLARRRGRRNRGGPSPADSTADPPLGRRPPPPHRKLAGAGNWADHRRVRGNLGGGPQRTFEGLPRPARRVFTRATPRREAWRAE